MKKIRIGISSIGSGVGQSVINSCNLSRLPLYTVGFGTNPLAFGLYECDDYAYTKSFYDPDYIDDIIAHCLEKQIDVFFPGHDDDAHIVSKNIEKFNENNIKVIVAGQALLDHCRDKEKMSDELNKIADVFVKSFDKKSFITAFQNNEIKLPVIAKPRDGYASKGIEIILDENDFDKIKDVHIVQELAVPHKNDPQRAFFDKQIAKRINPQISEISIQLVADEEGEIMGKMISYNKLNNGVPIEIIPYENQEVWDAIFKLYPTFKKLGLKGPFNIQGRLTDEGLKLFEMNARFTGITGLRAYMGFNEVEACIKKWMGLWTDDDKLCLNYNAFGIRQTSDKSISLKLNKEVTDLSLKVNHTRLKQKETLLITGSTGFVGQNLIKELLATKGDAYEIWAYARDKAKANAIFSTDKINYFDYNDFLNGNLSMGNIDCILHLGFARPHCSHLEIAESLEFTNEFFTYAVKNQVGKIINISSQSVYGQINQPLWVEEMPVAPTLPYSQAKFATEKLLESLVKFEPHVHYTSLRLAAVSGAQQGAVVHDLPSKLAKKLLNGEKLQIQGGQQELEFIDVRDVVSAIIAFLQTDSNDWQSIYNLGAEEIYSLEQITEKVVSHYHQFTENTASMEIVSNDKIIKFGMDSSKFQNLTGWKPNFTLNDMIQSIYNYYQA